MVKCMKRQRCLHQPKNNHEKDWGVGPAGSGPPPFLLPEIRYNLPMEKLTACDICQNRDQRVVSPGSEKENDLVQCAECGHLFLHPFPTKDYLEKAYAEELSINETSEARDRQQFLWKRRYRSTKSFLGAGKGLLRRSSDVGYEGRGKLLDVGCGEGRFLQQAKQDGWEGYGTEYHDEAARFAREQFQLDIIGGDLLEARFPGGKFDAVSMWHVLEHLYSPSTYLKEIHRILKPGGRLIVECPHVNADRVPPDAQYGYRRLHLHFFSRPAMVRLLQQCRFTVVSTAYEDPDAYKRVWTSIFHHEVRTAFTKLASWVRGTHRGSTIRMHARKTGS